MSENDKSFDTAYEWKAVLLLFLGFGLVGLDRWIIAPLWPTIAKSLHFDYTDLGIVVGILSWGWGIFAIVAGNLSDRLGRRRILLPALLLFSCMAGLSGAVFIITELVAIRFLMGATEGAYLSTSVALTGEASHPRRLGLNQGIQLSAFSLFGLALGPIIATQLLRVVPSWRWVFLVVMIPGLILAIFMYRVIREPEHLKAKIAARRAGQATPTQPAPRIPWLTLLKNRNVLLSMLGCICGMSCIFVLSATIPSYLENYLHMPVTEMGFITSGLGFGGFIGGIIVSAGSDWIGRRTATVVSFAIALVLMYIFVNTGARPWLLFWLLFGASFFGSGILGLLTGPVATEAVSPVLTSSAIGLVSGTGEIFGGGFGTMITGALAQHYGIQHVPLFSMIGLAVGVVVALCMRETAPRRVRARAARANAAAAGK